MEQSPFYIFGSGGHGRCVVETAIGSGMRVDGVLDDAPRETEVFGVPVYVASEFSFSRPFRFHVAIGNCQARREKFEILLKAGGEPESIIHQRAFVTPSATIGAGTGLLAFAFVDTNVRIGRNVIVNVGALVGHDSLIGNHCHVSAKAIVGANSQVGEGSWISLSATIKEGISIGEGSFIGMGALVSHDVEAHKKAISPRRRDCVVVDL